MLWRVDQKKCPADVYKMIKGCKKAIPDSAGGVYQVERISLKIKTWVS